MALVNEAVTGVSIESQTTQTDVEINRPGGAVPGFPRSGIVSAVMRGEDEKVLR